MNQIATTKNMSCDPVMEPSKWLIVNLINL